MPDKHNKLSIILSASVEQENSNLLKLCYKKYEEADCNSDKFNVQIIIKLQFVQLKVVEVSKLEKVSIATMLIWTDWVIDRVLCTFNTNKGSDTITIIDNLATLVAD